MVVFAGSPGVPPLFPPMKRVLENRYKVPQNTRVRTGERENVSKLASQPGRYWLYARSQISAGHAMVFV